MAAAKTGNFMNIKKRQLLSPQTMKFAVDKVIQRVNINVTLTERDTTFGCHALLVDYRGIPEMKAFDVPVILDIAHSLEEPNHESGVMGGKL